ncbi:MAG: hypothetical protein ACQET1_03500 [Gemmatimonadota bacterium]
MEQWIQETRQILERSPTGALPLSDIREELRRSGIHLGARDGWLLTALEARNDLFRIVRASAGPWASGLLPSEGVTILEDPWIVLQEFPSRGFGLGEQILARIRETVQALGRCVDDGSPSGVARWIRVNQEGARTCRALLGWPLTDA